MNATRADLPALVQHWVEAGIITPDQAAAIRADLDVAPEGPDGPDAAAAPAADRTPLPVGSLVAEAFGYLGGAIIIVALGLVAGRFWPDLSTAARLWLAGLTTVLLFVAGQAAPVEHGPTADRLRSVLWLLSTAVGAGFLGLLARLSFHWSEQHVAVFAAVGAAVYAAGLWWRHHRLLQHLALMLALIVAVSVGLSLLPDSGSSPAAGVWALGVAWALLGWGGVPGPRRETELVGVLVACGAATTFAAEPWGTPLALVTLAVAGFLAIRLRDLPVLAVTAVTTLLALPPMVTERFPGVLSAAVVLLVVGVALVGAAVFTVRRRQEEREVPAPGWATGTVAAALPPAALVAVVTTACVVVAALV